MSRFQQDKILYTMEWCKEMDTTFIKKLKEEAVAGRCHGDSDNIDVIRAAMAEVNNSLCKTYTFAKCLEQFRKLRRRYRVYSEILKHRGVWFDESTNTIRYEIETWEEINKIDPLVVAYMNKGDPAIVALRVIFCEENDSVGFFDLQDITHLSSNLQGLSDPQRYQYPRYGFDDQISTSFWSHVALPSSQGECNTSSSTHADNKAGDELRGTDPQCDTRMCSNIDKFSRT